MKKPIIAVDIDDVLADSTESLRMAVNARLGVDLQPHHYRIPGEYWGYYDSVWQANGIGGRVTLDELDPQMKEDQGHVQPMPDARKVLVRLQTCYDLVIVSARSLQWYDATIVWLETQLPGLFNQVVFADGLTGLQQRSKGKLCKEIGAQWLIDDNVDHAQTALDEGMSVVVFGEYGWHAKGIPDGAVPCKNWQEIGEYFGV